ncbi:MAG: hypothetical protein NQ127_00455 [Candidatus Cardinium sp.]|nr:hypothetical protein [Candidatus Cardinium sp.]
MGVLYGPIVRLVTAILGIIMSILFLTIQFNIGFTIGTLLYPTIGEGGTKE